MKPDSIYSDYTALLPTTAACSFILARTTHELNISLVRPIIFVAIVSYPLYLWHYPTIKFACQVHGPLTLSQRFLILAITLFGAYFTDAHLAPQILHALRVAFFILAFSRMIIGLILI